MVAPPRCEGQWVNPYGAKGAGELTTARLHGRNAGDPEPGRARDHTGIDEPVPSSTAVASLLMRWLNEVQRRVLPTADGLGATWGR